MRTAWHQTPAWLFFATGLMVMSSVAAASTRFVPGEVIVQSDPGSEVVTALSRRRSGSRCRTCRISPLCGPA
jgi:hypothetical protein